MNHSSASIIGSTQIVNLLDHNLTTTVTTTVATLLSNTTLLANRKGLQLSPLSYTISTITLCISIVLSTPGNMLVIWVITKTPHLRAKAVNILIVNLCLVDLVASFLDMPLMWMILQFNNKQLINNQWICDW